ncbi:MAG: SMC-Scp complex subunit ScpB [Promethearchaeota archaeon]
MDFFDENIEEQPKENNKKSNEELVGSSEEELPENNEEIKNNETNADDSEKLSKEILNKEEKHNDEEFAKEMSPTENNVNMLSNNEKSIETIIVDENEEDVIEDNLEKIKEEPEISEEELIEKQLKDYHRCQIEASLYAAGKPLSIEILSSKLEIPKKEVEELINDLAFDYLERSTALVIVQIGDRYQMQIKPEYTEKVSKFAQGGAIAEKYLRTLTIIALKQPIMKSLVVKLRGSGAYEHIKYLLDQGLISGVKKGRSQELTTTDKYAEMFGLPKDKQQMKQVMIAQLGLNQE